MRGACGLVSVEVNFLLEGGTWRGTCRSSGRHVDERFLTFPVSPTGLRLWFAVGPEEESVLALRRNWGILTIHLVIFKSPR